ncbi:MAG TPA: class I SAM-dependent methyltransferase [Streptosporangiaceae bacterium]|jgi:SAM-dependent methyltransferase
MVRIDPALAGHPDRLRWNARYASRSEPSFAPHPLAEGALALPLPPGPMLELACGPSGSALLAAARGRHVTAVDASDVALRLLFDEAARRGLGDLVTPVHGDLASWQAADAGYALVLCTGYWDRPMFPAAAAAAAAGGVIAWEALTPAARIERPQLPAAWCLQPGEPATLLPLGFDVISQQDAGPAPATRRQLLARRTQPAS